jgi:Icc-related predicted phosphoesterase
LAGDILVDKDLYLNEEVHTMGERIIRMGKSERFHDFFKEVCNEFPHVIYICGNHEHYNGDITQTYDNLYRKFDYLPNLHIMDNSIFHFGNVTFFGGTLWTDMNKSDPITLWDIKNYMNDFQIIKNSARMLGGYKPAKFTPEDSVNLHYEFLEKLKKVLENNEYNKIVVVGHHAPSKQSIHELYKNQTISNGAYSSNLDDFIIDNPKIKLWIHGHTHHPFDYMIGQTRVVCNPRGYIGYEENAKEFSLKFLEV